MSKIKLTVNERPTPEAVRFARENKGLSQPQAAELVHLRAFQRWSEYERGLHEIDLARWELFLLLTNQHPTLTSGPKRGTSNA